ncbi:hypothetical protein FSP39_007775 [Pinctada imbricata]|uniref:Uncharacterized protein n=1 Tax=Pinctada imbricata TaxID=66713 RepID=A0AA88XTU9_PINIB|nr:hypothetical protein FSP39_007775 [Pinctada imbricata]
MTAYRGRSMVKTLLDHNQFIGQDLTKDQFQASTNELTPSSDQSSSFPTLSRRWKSVPTELGRSLSDEAQAYIYDGSGSECIHRILEGRRQQRISRRRPWTEKVVFAPSNKNKNIEFFYENHLPQDVNVDDLKRRSRKYVANVKYGNIYELRKNETKVKEKPESSQAWLWERDFELWLTDRSNGNRQDKLGGKWTWDLSRTAPTSSTSAIKPEDTKNAKTQEKTTKKSHGLVSDAQNKGKQTSSQTKEGSRPASRISTPNSTPRPASRITGRSTPRNKLRSSKDDKPHADLFA